MPYLWEDGRFLHTLIVSAPGCGKTTMLRDIIRQISDGESPYPGLTVGVVALPLAMAFAIACGLPHRCARLLSEGGGHDDADPRHVARCGGSR